jgi:hypothetical protein
MVPGGRLKLSEMQKEMLGRQSAAIRKCQHEIYWPAADARAYYCPFCTPEGLAAMTKPGKKSTKRKKKDDESRITGEVEPN